MISEERLKKLVEQKATIYAPDTMWGSVGTICVNDTFKIKDGYLQGNIKYKDLEGASCLCSIPLKELYEFEEDAKFIVDMYAVKTLEFSPPTFEEIKEGQPYRFNFTSKGKYYNFFASVLLIELLEVNCEDSDNVYSDQIVCCHSTKENYIKAVEYAKKLFLGESDER